MVEIAILYHWNRNQLTIEISFFVKQMWISPHSCTCWSSKFVVAENRRILLHLWKLILKIAISLTWNCDLN